MKQAYWVSLGALGGAVAIALGCGGVGDADSLFGATGGTGSGGQSGATSSVGAGVTGGTSGVGATGTSGVGTTGVTSGASTSVGTTTGGGITTSSVATTSASTTTASTSTSTGGGGTTIPCGNENCPVAPESACCFSRYDMPFPTSQCVTGAPGADGCDTSPTQSGFQTRITCHDASECGAQQICCGHRVYVNGGQITYYDDVSCQDSCAKPSIQLCNPQGPNKCPSGTTCKKSSLLPEGYFVCGG